MFGCRRGSVDHFDHVRQLGDRAAHLGGVLELDDLVHLAEAEADQEYGGQVGAEHRLRGIGQYARRAQLAAGATFLPRRCATDFGEVWLLSASKVARTML